jgi:hypothetical protein
MQSQFVTNLQFKPPTTLNRIMSDEQFDLMKEWASQEGVPGADATEIRGKIIAIFCDKNQTAPVKNAKISNAVVEDLEKRGKFFFHETWRDFASTMFFDTKRKVLLCIQSDQFQSWLSQHIQINRAEKTFTCIMKEVENTALSGSTTSGILPEHFWGTRSKIIYISNGDGQIVRISAGKVETVDNGTDGVLFAAGKTLSKWKFVTPVDPFKSCSLFRDISCTAKHGRSLLRLWFFSLPSNPKCKPPLATTGTIGSGKTRCAIGISEFYGMAPRAVKANEKGESDFWGALNAGGIFILDNADTHIKWLPDAAAAASTGGSVVKRRLYTDTDNVQLHANSWLIITSANPRFASDAGLADRLLVIRMDRREGNTSDEFLSQEILANRDSGLSFLCETLSKALADETPTPSGLNSRHPDFAAFAVRIGRVLGEEREFIEALRSAEADKSLICVEQDTIGSVLSEIVEEKGEISGTASEIANALQNHDFNAFQHVRTRTVSTRIANLWPHFASLFCASKETISGGALKYTLKRKTT